ncbi:glycogen phosphorylase [Intrasporangium oryzae NRRL B-24470]|uniref:glycogen phosphorylase n=1 Tax=Intrasporangium oryzae NRRL B-24470 TaxID=1386089 RepID=W9GBR1_9MICO|nr:alpha-glucan family phosphorylase [Intrasporangium oryzae]EWT02263.1 glycogen phosphorylase [Intrasporangium oryzae NRRL B-24470]
MKAIRRFSVRTVLPARIEGLGVLASNLRWSWHPPTRDLFESIDPRKWADANEDPVKLLSRLSTDELAALAADDGFVSRVSAAKDDLDHYLTHERWYQRWSREEAAAGRVAPAAIAYFSPEFGITAVLPQYSGGLGILAGDHLKTASDLGVPIVGVGLFYKTGYFKQALSRDGWQLETYPVLDPDGLPLSLLREEDGSPAVVSVGLPAGRVLHAHVWKAQVGRVPLLLLDSDVPGNDEETRAVTESLYGGGGDTRLEQELLLGVGGVRALRLWSRLTGAPAPEVYHTNEGHAGFLGVERIAELVRDHGLAFDEALEAVRSATVFTTHTPVPAGIDRFDAAKINQFFGGSSSVPGVPVERLLALGAEDYEGGQPGIFNMAVMGLRLAQRANGVSELHGVVSRGMFDGLWPGFDDVEVPITSITNGVHAPTWVDREVYEVARRHLGTADIAGHDLWDRIDEVPAEAIWQTKRAMRTKLVQDARRRVRSSWLKRGAAAAELGWVDSVLDPDVLTIGFARRVPTYKRLTLMLSDKARLKRLLLDPERPVQLVIAGKSHPADETGKRLIQEMVQFADDPEVRHRIVFLPNYDIAMAQHLYPGCDVWLNNPLRPFEACGTSGMKAALNGGLNLSILDGWWDEWFDGHNGWAIPTADGVEDPDRRDDIEAAALYDLIENTVARQFYDRDADGLPRGWISMMTHTLKTLGPKVLASRMVEDYTTRLYGPAACAGRALNGPEFKGAKDLAAYKARVRAAWPRVRVDHVEPSGVSDSPQVGDRLHVRAYVDLGGLSPDEVTVQLIHGRVSDGDDLREMETAPLELVEGYDGGRFQFAGEQELTRTGSFGYSVRVVPRHPALATEAELGLARNA